MNIMCLSIYVGLYWFSSLYFVIFTVQILSRFQFSSVQFSRSVVSNSLQLHESQHARPPSITNSQSPPKPMSIELMMPSIHLILCRPLLLLTSLPALGSFLIILYIRKGKMAFRFYFVPSVIMGNIIPHVLFWLRIPLKLLLVYKSLSSFIFFTGKIE